ncbi:hypothetical protein [Streptomyces sp. AV19]|uniref:hypothetical protein n=1 Tax=Streptomyces sp. AV19 TaxID=2793068 RepID=UPI001F2D7D7A|nr:hypothetical protein [Streptomyces sp. AV19]MDG4534851.1 hypothetical protein [Streptomyces sp. AV19]
MAAPLRDIERAGDEAMATARRLLRVPGQDRPHRDPLHGLDRVREPTEGFRREHPATRVELWVDPGLGAEPVPGLAASVHRIVAEAPANSARHCPGARAVVVSLRRSAGRLFVSVRDECVRAPAVPRRAPGDGGGLGLAGIAERADAIGGSLTAGPVPGGLGGAGGAAGALTGRRNCAGWAGCWAGGRPGRKGRSGRRGTEGSYATIPWHLACLLEFRRRRGQMPVFLKGRDAYHSRIKH